MSGVLVDTSFWYGFFDRTDDRHPRAVELARAETHQPYITQPCLAELVTILSQRIAPQLASKVWRGMRDGRYGTVLEVTLEDEVTGRGLVDAHPDRRLSYADVTACALVRRLDLPKVLASDDDYRVLLPERIVSGWR
jgi:predicted nucleic acid-binding protein